MRLRVFVRLHQQESLRRYGGQNRENRVIRDKALQGVTIRDKTCSADKYSPDVKNINEAI
jgi:hypothetical protein